MTDLLFKVLKEGSRSPMGSGTWTPGKWRGVRGDLRLCDRGLHYATGPQVLRFINYGPELWAFEVEPKARTVSDDMKSACSRGRITTRYEKWTRDSMVAFAADCAEHVLPIFEARYPNDDRPHKAVEAARGGVNAVDAYVDAYAAAYAAYAAANAAAYAVNAAYAAVNAAYAAAYAAYAAANAAAYAVVNAAYAAAYAAVNAANAAAEREWQYTRLLHYLGAEQ